MAVKPLLSVFVALLLSSQAADAAQPCADRPADGVAVRLAGVDPAGDPLLADGRTLRIVGLAPRQDAAEAGRFATALTDWRDRDLGLVGLGERDRWGRLPARLLVTEPAGGPARDLADLLIETGAATRLPEALAARCGAKPERAGARPQTVSAGASAFVGSIDGHDIVGLKAQAGRFIAMEGRIASIGERSQRTYLNLSRRRGEAGSIVLSKRLWRELQDAGWTVAGVTGKRVRARGVLSGQDGLLLEAATVLALELID